MAATQSVAEPRTWTVSAFLGTSIGIDDDTGAGNSVGIGLADVRHVTPYATFGLGFERSSIDADPDILALTLPSSTEVAFNFGGGAKYPISDTLLVCGDIRRFESNDLAPDYWRLYGGITFTFGR